MATFKDLSEESQLALRKILKDKHIPFEETADINSQITYLGNISFSEMGLESNAEVFYQKSIKEQQEILMKRKLEYDSQWAANGRIGCLLNNPIGTHHENLLLLAIKDGNEELVAELLRCGANPNLAVNNRLPLEAAIVLNNNTIFNLLLNAGADILLYGSCLQSWFHNKEVLEDIMKDLRDSYTWVPHPDIAYATGSFRDPNTIFATLMRLIYIREILPYQSSVAKTLGENSLLPPLQTMILDYLGIDDMHEKKLQGYLTLMAPSRDTWLCLMRYGQYLHQFCQARETQDAADEKRANDSLNTVEGQLCLREHVVKLTVEVMALKREVMVLKRRSWEYQRTSPIHMFIIGPTMSVSEDPSRTFLINYGRELRRTAARPSSRSSAAVHTRLNNTTTSAALNRVTSSSSATANAIAATASSSSSNSTAAAATNSSRTAIHYRFNNSTTTNTGTVASRIASLNSAVAAAAGAATAGASYNRNIIKRA